MARRAGVSRTVHVDGDDYRWLVTPDPAMPELRVCLRVWREGPRGRQLHVPVNFYDAATYFFLYTSAPEDRRHVFQLEPVRPRFVAAVIRAARAAGWDPGARTDDTPAVPWPDAIDPDPDTLPEPTRIA
ncbi:MAG: hypothetical protein HOV68_34015 [Streptomycetaceae bacterium]|nr:hypothetical protein [Streptomycetaceae bacterium]